MITALASPLTSPAAFSPSGVPPHVGIGVGAEDARERFSSVIARASGAPRESPEVAARKAAEELVAVTLVQPLLSHLRSTSSAAPPFAPSRGEQQFQGMADAQLAQRIVGAAQFPLVDRLARDLLKRGGVREAGSVTPPAPPEGAPLPLGRSPQPLDRASFLNDRLPMPLTGSGMPADRSPLPLSRPSLNL